MAVAVATRERADALPEETPATAIRAAKLAGKRIGASGHRARGVAGRLRSPERAPSAWQRTLPGLRPAPGRSEGAAAAIAAERGP